MLRLSVLALFLSGCASDSPTNAEGERGEHSRRESGEHSGREKGEHSGKSHSEEGEESGTQFTKTQSYDEVRHGARLKLAFDAASNTFKGTVKNTTTKTLDRVRVEIHLSNGTELGPTPAGNLAAGETRDVELTATKTAFQTWSAHAEVGRTEHEGKGKD